MAKFDINKKGYDVEQVDNFINKLTLKYEEKLSEQKDRVFSLKNELAVINERLENYRDKDKQISQALIFAVEKAEQIESKASKLYDLEVKRLRLLYSQWQEMIKKLATQNLSKDITIDLASFTQTITEVLEQNARFDGNMIRKDLHKNSNNYIRNLLNKMDYAINSKPKTQVAKNTLENLSSETEKENARMIDLSGKLNRIKVKGKGNMAENYLNSEEETPSIFSRTITRKRAPKKQESGFDLEDALNPKEDLDEIMKAFDFFLDEQDEDN